MYIGNKSTIAVNRSAIIENGANPASLSIDGNSRNFKTSRNNSSKNKWGIEGYYVPGNNWMFHRAKTFWSNSKKENIIEKEARLKKEIPPPTMYQKVWDWSKINH